jgi:hypothetical protein
MPDLAERWKAHARPRPSQGVAPAPPADSTGQTAPSRPGVWTRSPDEADDTSPGPGCPHDEAFAARPRASIKTAPCTSISRRKERLLSVSLATPPNSAQPPLRGQTAKTTKRDELVVFPPPGMGREKRKAPPGQGPAKTTTAMLVPEVPARWSDTCVQPHRGWANRPGPAPALSVPRANRSGPPWRPEREVARPASESSRAGVATPPLSHSMQGL